MPQFDPATFTPQLFWLAVTFVVLLATMWRYALPRLSDILESRQRHIDADLEKAATLKAETDEVLAEYEKALAEARDRAGAAVKRVSEEMAAESARRHEAFGRDLMEKAGQAERRIADARNEALANLAAVAGEVAGAATAKLIGIEAPPEQVRKAVEDALGARR